MPRSPDVPVSLDEQAQAVDVIIVLGAAQKPDGAPGPAMERRVRRGVELYHEGKAPRLLMSGGITAFREPESQTMAALASEMGVNPDHVLQENRSRRTLDNAHFCAKILKTRGFRRCILVTDDFHMARALTTFQSFGVAPESYPVRTGWTFYTAVSYVRELVARSVNSRRIHAYHRSIRGS